MFPSNDTWFALALALALVGATIISLVPYPWNTTGLAFLFAALILPLACYIRGRG